MTTAKNEMSHIGTHIEQFTAKQQREFFESLKESKFSGQLVISDSQETTWVFYLYLGRLIYANGGVHPIRRWRRYLVAYCPQRLAQVQELQKLLANLAEEDSRMPWEYQLLCRWLDQEKITAEQASKIIKATIIEILFDITQAVQVSCKTIKDNLLSTRLDLIDPEQAIAEAHKLYAAWQQAKVADHSPNMAPVIRQPEMLRQKTSTQVYQNLTQLLDGQQTLRDLGIRLKRDLVTVTRSLLPYIQLGLVQLIKVGDISLPLSSVITQKLNKTIVPRRKIIACIDDSPVICQTMNTIMTEAGYQFISEMNGLRAIAMLLSRKPDLIFLDLVMPNTNGYEICSQLRKLSYFRTTPIIILTGNDGIVDRVRAKVVGSTDFLAKPIQPKKVLATIDKYLTQKV